MSFVGTAIAGLALIGAGASIYSSSQMANAANVGAVVITGTAQSVSNNQIAAGQAQAQGLLGVAGANRDMAYGIANSVTGNVGTSLNYVQMQNLINANTPATPYSSTPVPMKFPLINPPR